jgi:ABC-type branched-subunit amino acid transport system substrate-binding protein
VPGQGVDPFHDFREQDLDYKGPEDEIPDLDELSEVVIGWFGPADSAHPLHGDLWVAASIAVDEANRDGGWRGLPFRLAPRWSENVWGSGVSQVAQMAYQDRAWAILGSVDGASTHLAEQIVAKARLPLVSPVSTDESVNLAGVPWMFSLAPGDHLWAPLLAQRVVDTAGNGPFFLIAVTDHDSRLTTEALLDELARLDRGPAMRLDVLPATTDAAGSVSRLELTEAVALLLVAGPEDGARLLRAVREKGFTGPVFGTPPLARRRFLELAAGAAEGLRVPALLEPGSAPERRVFARLFAQRTGSAPDWAAAHTYDATRLLLEAIRTAGLSRTGIRQTLVEISPWKGVTGIIEWDPTGQNMRAVETIGIVEDGHLVVE